MATIHPRTDGSPTGNIYVDGLIWGGSWTGTLGTGVTLTWTTVTRAVEEGATIRGRDWGVAELAALRAAFQAWDDVSGLSFVERPAGTAGTDLAEMILTAQGRRALEFGPEDLGQHSPPSGESPKPLVGYYADTAPSWTAAGLATGGYAYVTLLHEIGHGLGLAHPHDGGGDGQTFPGVTGSDDPGTHGLNQGIFTVMSYVDGWRTRYPNHAENGWGWNATPMALDIAAIQVLYGRNESFRAGGDTYALPTVNGAGTAWACLWDTGGADTISAAGATGAAIIDLRAAPLTGPNAGGYVSYASGIVGGFTIANGVTIENAVGGAGNDAITGNVAANRLDGGAGRDALTGGAGDDTYLVDDARDRVIEAEGGGADTVLASVGYGLAGNVEHLILTGTAIRGTGNALANRMEGSAGANRLIGDDGADTLLGGAGTDRLEGGAGSDRLHGGAGGDVLIGGADADRFILEEAPGGPADRIQDFEAGVDRILLDAGIFGLTGGVRLAAEAFAAGRRATEADDRVLYDAATGVLRWDADGDDSGAAVTLAVLAAGTALTAADIWVA